MKYAMLLIAVLMVGAAFAQDTQNVSGDAVETITVGPDPYPGDGATGEEQIVQIADVQQCTPQLQVFSENLQAITTKPASDRTVIVRDQVRIVNRHLVEKRIVRKQLTLSQLTSMLCQLGYIGRADAWATSLVNQAKSRGLIVGTHPGYSAADKRCKAPLSRQDAAVAFLRHDDNRYAHREAIRKGVDDHNGLSNAHAGLLAPIRRDSRLGKWAFWLLLVVLALLLAVLYLLRCNRRITGYPAIPVVPPVAPGGGVAPAPAAPFVPQSRGVSRRWV